MAPVCAPSPKDWLTLTQASHLSGLAIHELKRDIQEGNLPSTWKEIPHGLMPVLVESYTGFYWGLEILDTNQDATTNTC
jgi:hypothetical protein